MWTSILIYTVIAVGTFLYLYSKRKYSYWKDRNVVHIEPTFFYGNIKQSYKRKVHSCEIFDEIYKKVKDQGQKYGGAYSFFAPQFVPVDLELIKCILQKDFSYFPNHGGFVNEENDPLTGHLFNLEDEKWRNLRAKLTPTFTSGKMKMMFQTMLDCTDGLQELLKKSFVSRDPVDIKNILACFTTDVIGSVAFGLEINSMKNPDSEFRKYGQKIFTPSVRGRIIFTILSLVPKWIVNKIGLKIFEKETEDFYLNLVKNTVAYREENNIFRKDFMHLLIQLKNIGKISDNDEESLKHKNDIDVHGLTLNEMAAQSFVFFIAGFETSATTMTFALLELAQRPDIQEKVRNEITKVLNKYENKLQYDSIMEMEYLELVVLETLRKHPPLSLLPRVCSKKYHVPDSDLILEPNTRVNIPVFSIHRDPEYYPNPDNFDPERFTEKNKANRHQFAYMPFGEGPRTCIGLRFGKLQTKMGLCCVLKNYRVTLNEKTQLPIKYETGFIISVKNGIWLNLEPIMK